MADILIRGMKMPKNCSECGQFRWNNILQSDVCRIMEALGNDGRFHSETEGIDNCPSWCPIVPIPPHGDLIDRDVLAKQLGITDMDCYKCAWGNHGFCGRGGDFNDACEAIEEAPTIIEAEGEE